MTICSIFAIIAISYYAAKGTVYYDTELYHAQAIQWIEEYGVVKGLGNLHNRLAYNSSMFAVTALFSFKDWLGQSLRPINGYIVSVAVLYVISSLKKMWQSPIKTSVVLKIAMLSYIALNISDISSPNSDTISMVFMFILVTMWFEQLENKEKDMIPYGLICVGFVFAMSLKLSVAFWVLLTLYPLIMLVKEKKWKHITIFLVMGFIAILPFLIRNVIISGYLVYPYAQIDIFNVDWKMPTSVVEWDYNEIQVWGRGLKDVSKIDYSVIEWFPVWFETLADREQMIFIGSVLSSILFAIGGGVLYHKKRMKLPVYFSGIIAIVAACAWFFSAPLMRYGQALLYVVISIFIGNILTIIFENRINNIIRVLSICCGIGIIVFFTSEGSWNYNKDIYQLIQKDYDVRGVDYSYIEDIAIYYPIEGDRTGYYGFPATPYNKRIEIICEGEDIIIIDIDIILMEKRLNQLKMFILQVIKQYAKPYIAIVLVGIYNYYPILTNKLSNPDTIWNSFVYKKSHGWENALGRVGLEKILALDYYIIDTTQVTLICIFLLAGIGILVADLFEVKSKVGIFIIGFLTLVTPTICATLTYYYCSKPYIIAYFLSVFAIYLVCKNGNKVKVFIAMLLIAISLSLYQAYVPVAIILAAFYLLYLIDSGKTFYREAIYCLMSGIGGVAIYVIMLKIMEKASLITLTSDRGFSELGNLNLTNGFLKRIYYCYRDFIKYYVSESFINNSMYYKNFFNVMIGGILGIMLVSIMIKKCNKLIDRLIVGIIIVLIPIMFMFIIIMAPNVSIYEITGLLMIPTMNYIYVFVFIFLMKLSKKTKGDKLIRLAGIVSIVCIMLISLRYNSIFQMYMELNLTKSYTVAVEMSAAVNEQLEDMEQKIMVGGDMENGNYPDLYPELYEIVYPTVASSGMFWKTAVGRQSCWEGFWEQYCGISYNLCTGDEYLEIVSTDEYAEMKNFPENGSIKEINGIMVIKLSD